MGDGWSGINPSIEGLAFLADRANGIGVFVIPPQAVSAVACLRVQTLMDIRGHRAPISMDVPGRSALGRFLVLSLAT